jgi:hypothetical protein
MKQRTRTIRPAAGRRRVRSRTRDAVVLAELGVIAERRRSLAELDPTPA